MGLYNKIITDWVFILLNNSYLTSRLKFEPNLLLVDLIRLSCCLNFCLSIFWAAVKKRYYSVNNCIGVWGGKIMEQSAQKTYRMHRYSQNVTIHRMSQIFTKCHRYSQNVTNHRMSQITECHKSQNVTDFPAQTEPVLSPLHKFYKERYIV